MAYSYVLYTGNGTTTNYTFPFPYLNQTDVKVRVNGVLTGFTFLNSSTVTISPAPATGSLIEIRRETITPLAPVDFSDGSVLLERDLDLLTQYNLYSSQEAIDVARDSISTDSLGNFDAKGKRLVNVGYPFEQDDAVTVRKLNFDYPKVSIVSDNITSVVAVANDLGASVITETDLGSVADTPTTLPPGGTSKIDTVSDNIVDVQLVADNITAIQGASTAATNAAASASSASTSASTATTQAGIATTKAGEASTSASNAATSATNASNSASAASTSASTATTKANEASTSATAAASSASSASTSASTATTKATEASTSASNAASSATAASSSASSASSSATSASDSATTATTQAGIATTKAGEASTSASNAATSASNAANSATTASTQASNAGTSATNAASSATAAAGSATSASTSATNASSSATAASVSASDAAASAAATAALLDNFDDRYLGAKNTAPSLDNDGNALQSGALYFNTGVSVAGDKGMWVYDGSGWLKASSAAQAALTVYRYTATANQTTFSGADLSSLTLSYIAGGLVVALNGSVLVGNGNDYTASNGTSVVLTTGATAGDSLEVYAFSSFSIASLNGSAIVDDTVTAAKLSPILDLGSI